MKPSNTPSIPHLFLCGLLLLGASVKSAEAVLLTAGKPLALNGTHGRFDFLAIDVEGRRLLAAHTGNLSLDIIDLDHEVVTKIVPTGAAQSAAVDVKARRYYVSVSKPPQLVILDAENLAVVGKVPLSGPADLLAFNSKEGRVYVGHDDGKELWVIDPSAAKITATVELPSEAPEDLGFDTPNKRLFQAMKIASTVAVIDLATNKVTADWSTAPAKGPHGMAVLNDEGAILLAGANGKLVMMSQGDGKVVSSTEIGPGVDQIAYDPQLHRVYCASSTGKIIVVQVAKDNLSTVGTVASSEGARSVAVDLKTHRVWVAYAKGDASFLQPFTPGK